MHVLVNKPFPLSDIDIDFLNDFQRSINNIVRLIYSTLHSNTIAECMHCCFRKIDRSEFVQVHIYYYYYYLYRVQTIDLIKLLALENR